MIKAFLFDYDGVITQGANNDRIFGTLANNLDVPVEQTTQWLMEVWRPYLKGRLTENEVWKHVENKYGKPIDVSLRNIWFTWDELKPLSEMLELVKSLKSKGFTVGILSNFTKENDKIVQMHGGFEPFDFRVLSCETGYAKPDTEIFHTAIEKLQNVQPNEVVFLDDREKNAIAANQLGMIGIHVTNHADAIKKVRELANTKSSSSGR